MYHISRYVVVMLFFLSLSELVLANGILTIPDIQAPTPCVFEIPINWENNGSNISTLVIRWTPTDANLFPLEAEPSTNLGTNKKLMFSKIGQQINIIIYGGVEPIPDGQIANVIVQIPESFPNNSQIPISGLNAEAANDKALPQNITITTGKITVINNPNFHSADTNKDWTISFSEVLRVVQLFNAREYHCESGTEDGYAPFEGNKTCTPHKLDYNPQDWKITLNELLRLIQFFNFPGGSYHPDNNGEDKYAPGPFSK
ncbi:MAG TPA: hypothetical protein PLX23_05065 [Candidatus Hydrogenedens sp.]|nr:hypothetical protein [Candidatus Hydrogenedens sp.]